MFLGSNYNLILESAVHTGLVNSPVNVFYYFLMFYVAQASLEVNMEVGVKLFPNFST